MSISRSSRDSRVTLVAVPEFLIPLVPESVNLQNKPNPHFRLGGVSLNSEMAEGRASRCFPLSALCAPARVALQCSGYD
jgi:hypothetical protein